MARASKLCPSVYREHLEAGDTAERHAIRLAEMALMRERNDKVRHLATLLWTQVAALTLQQLKANGSRGASARMLLRRIHNLLVYPARRTHCHSALYRSRAADDLLRSGNMPAGADAVLHCEHTVPTGSVLEQLHLLFLAGRMATPSHLLEWILSTAIVSVLHSREARGDDPSISLNRRRPILGRTSAWRCDHPDFQAGTVSDEGARPFLRYVGTGIEIVYVATGEAIRLEEDNVAAHRARIAHLPLYDVRTYFP